MEKYRIYMCILVMLFNFSISVSRAQEGKPFKPQSDEQVREQTKKESLASISPSLTARLKQQEETVQKWKQEAEERGLDSDYRYLKLINEFEKQKVTIEDKIQTAGENASITKETEKEIENDIRNLEKQVKLIEVEIFGPPK